MAPRFDIIDIGVLLLVVVTIIVAALFAFLIWRNAYIRGWRAARSHVKPLCPACGYNLAGLTQCRCPECGRTFTLDALWEAYLLKAENPEDSFAADRPERTSHSPEPRTAADT